MGRSQSRVIVAVVAPVALLPGIVLSPGITVWYSQHRRTVLISFNFRSSLPPTSTRLGTALPSLSWSSSRGSVTAITPHPALSLWCPATTHLASSKDSWTPSALPATRSPISPAARVFMAPVLLPSCLVVFGDKHILGSLKAFVADGLSQGPLLRIWVFFGFSHCWVFLGFLVDAFFWLRVLFVFFVEVFSAWALGAGFRPGVFLPWFPPP